MARYAPKSPQLSMQHSLVSSGADDLALHKASLREVRLRVLHKGVCQVAQTDPRCDAVREADKDPGRAHAAHIAPHLKQAEGAHECLQRSCLSKG